MNIMNTTALARLGKEANRDPISLLISGKALIDLKGRNTLKVRNDFISPVDAPGDAISRIPTTTTIKSSQFQASRK
jgi:hypothetical protein